MSQPSEPAASQPIFAQPWALRFAFLMLAGMTLVAGLGIYDKSQRTKLETSSETTSVGDKAYYPLPPDKSKLPAVAAAWEGKLLYVTELETVRVRDANTVKAGRDAERNLNFYRLRADATEEERKKAGEAFVLLKVAEGEYLPLKAPAKQ